MKPLSSLGSIYTSLVAILLLLAGSSAPVLADTAAEIETDARHALNKLYARVPAAKALAGSATAILVFPKIIKAGLLVGGQYGEGVLLKGGRTAGYYNTAGASYGLQAGAQSFGYAMFFMSAESLKYLESSEGFEVGVGPSVVVVDEGMGKSLTTTTAKEDVYAFIFGQSGLMAGIGIQGNKITKIDKR
jgi:lipid-binding SYLF domain-containing protein